jgi:hypothetical protein
VTGFADLVLRAQPRLANVNIDVTEGRTFRFNITDLEDGAGAAIDLTAATIVCKVVTDVDGSDVVTLTGTGSSGGLSITASAATMASLAVGATKYEPRQCLWYCKVTSGTDVVQFWGPEASNFLIWAE